MISIFKKYKIWSSLIAALGIFTLFVEVFDGYDIIKSKLISHQVESQLDKFKNNSGIIGHKTEGGMHYLQYKTCEAPKDTPLYYISIWVNGVPVEARKPTNGYYDINTWYKDTTCENPWYGKTPIPAGDIKITWYFLVDGELIPVEMNYTI